ncbi:MAG: GDP-mannose 4,6-dehydratase [Alphaproteobacteria bacterium]|nr:GDP-mannose 4,6-dehydratase [Alphaproteobacteria bacterium]
MLHVLITGGAGFIGSHTAEALLARGDRVTVLDAFDFGYDPALKAENVREALAHPGYRLVRGDIRDAALLAHLFTTDRPDVVVHLAARAGVRPSLVDPHSYIDVNLRGTTTLLEAMRDHGLDRLVFASSSSVYGARGSGTFKESDVVDVPASPYAATKRAGELLTATWHHLYGIQATCLRFFTVYGPRQRPDMAIRIFCERVRAGEPITMFGDGSSERDYTFVDDIVAGVVSAVDRPLGHCVLNLGNAEPVRLDTLIRKIGQATGCAPLVTRSGDQPGDVPRTCADVSRAEALLDYRPTTPLDVGLRRFVRWLGARTPRPTRPPLAARL